MIIQEASRVIVDAVVSLGVIPLPVTMFGVTVPEKNIFAAPPPVAPKLACVTVPVPPVPAGKSIFATGDVDPAAGAENPPVVRATLTRA